MSGKWVVFTEDGAFAPLGNVWYATKREAVEVCSGMTLDPRPTPKVERISKGHYIYRSKDVDHPSQWGEEFTIKHQSVLNQDELDNVIETQYGMVDAIMDSRRRMTT